GAGCVLVEHRVAEWLPLMTRVVVLEPGGGAVADGPPEEVLGTHGERLAAAGVWVPGRLPRPVAGWAGRTEGAAGAGEGGAQASGDLLLTAERLAARPPGGREAAVRDVDLTVHAG